MGGFNFRLGTYNVPSGSSANPYGEARSAEFDGMGWDGLDGPEKCPLNFFKLCGHLELIYIYIYILVYEIKIVTNILMGFKI